MLAWNQRPHLWWECALHCLHPQPFHIWSLSDSKTSSTKAVFLSPPCRFCPNNHSLFPQQCWWLSWAFPMSKCPAAKLHPQPSSYLLLWDRVSLNFPGQPWTQLVIPGRPWGCDCFSASASGMLGITGLGYLSWMLFILLLLEERFWGSPQLQCGVLQSDTQELPQCGSNSSCFNCIIIYMR